LLLTQSVVRHGCGPVPCGADALQSRRDSAAAESTGQTQDARGCPEKDTKDETVVDSVVIGGSAGKSDWYMPRFQMGFGGSDVVPGCARCLPSNERDDDVTGGTKSNKKAGNNKCARPEDEDEDSVGLLLDFEPFSFRSPV